MSNMPTIKVEAALSSTTGISGVWDSATSLPTVSSGTGASGTIVFSSAHGLATGNTIGLSGFTPSAWNGAWVVTVTNATTVTIGLVTTNMTVIGTAVAGVTGIWDAATWGPDIVWNDITKWVSAFDTRIGRQRETDHFAAGIGSITLWNDDGRFSPDNLSGPYVSGGVTGLRPWRPIRITATWNGVTYPVFYAYAKTWQESYGIDGWRPTVTVPLNDGLALLGAHNGVASNTTVFGSGETTGKRINRLLADAAWTQPTNVDTGQTTCQGTTLSTNTFQEILNTADSEGVAAACWQDPDGTFIFERAYALLENSRSNTSQVTFGDGATVGASSELPYESITLAYDGDLLWNIASIARNNGTTQTASDNTSRALYGDRRYSVSNLVCETDATAAQIASFQVARYAQPDRRVTEMRIHPSANTTLWTTALGRRIRDLVTVNRRPPGSTVFTISRPCFIDGIEHRFVADPGDWVTTYRMSSASWATGLNNPRWDTGLWDTALWAY